MRGLGFELLEAQRAGIEWIAGEVCGELIGNVVVDQRLIALFGKGGVGVADELELTGPGGVVVELELYSGGVDGGGGGQPVGVDADLGVVGAEGDDVGWGVVEVEKAGSDFVSGEEEVRSAGSPARLEHGVHVQPVGVDLVIGKLRQPCRVALVAEGNEHVQQVDGGAEAGSDGIGVVGEAAAGVHDDERDVHALLVNGTDLALNEAVRAAVLAVVGGEDDDGVVDDALRQLVELIEDVTDLLIDDLSDLGVAVEAALPVVEGRESDAEASVSVAIGPDPEATLKRVSGDASPDGLLKLLNEGMGGGFAGCGVVVGVLPVGRQKGVAEEGRRFELVGVPGHDRRIVGIVQDLIKRGARLVLIVVRKEVGVGEELGASGEELAVVRIDVADGQAPWAIGGLDVLQVG